MKLFQSSEDFASALAGTKYRDFQRRQFWSTAAYPTAGTSNLILFGDSVSGSVNAQQTNLPRASSFGDCWFLIKSIQSRIYIANRAITSAAGTDATSLLSDFLMGFAQAGVFTMQVNGKDVIQMNKPFLRFAGNDKVQINSAGVTTLTLVDATPNTLGAFVSPPPWGEPVSQLENNAAPYLLDPARAMEPDGNFTAGIAFPSGLIPAIATTQITSNTTLYVGIEFDGIAAFPIA